MKYGFLFILLLSALGVNAQSWWDLHWDIKAHDRGQLHFKAGWGVPRTESGDFKKYSDYPLGSSYNLVGAGPFYSAVEYGFNRKLSFAATFSYVNFKSSWTEDRLDPTLNKMLPQEYGVIVNNMTFGGRFNYHLYTSTVWDVYAGSGVLYDTYKSTSYTHYTPDTLFNAYYKPRGTVNFEMGAGFRYFFMNRTAWYFEVGYAKSYAQTGVIIKITQPKSNRGF